MCREVLPNTALSSRSPTAGGQYHWVSEFAPRRFQKSLSYSVGWLISMGWQTFLCTVAYEAVSNISSLADGESSRTGGPRLRRPVAVGTTYYNLLTPRSPRPA